NEFLDQNRDSLSQHEIQQLSENTWDAIHNQVDSHHIEKPTLPLWNRWLPYVAAAIILFAGGWLLIKSQKTESPAATAEIGQDIFPLGDRAILTLSDGRTIELNAQQAGIVFSNDHITYIDGSSVHNERLFPNEEYRLSTPKGATYHITLPDGTKVWLNGGSTIKYPGNFENTTRHVELEGEAYFSVVKQNGVPF